MNLTTSIHHTREDDRMIWIPTLIIVVATVIHVRTAAKEYRFRQSLRHELRQLHNALAEFDDAVDGLRTIAAVASRRQARGQE